MKSKVMAAPARVSANTLSGDVRSLISSNSGIEGREGDAYVLALLGDRTMRDKHVGWLEAVAVDSQPAAKKLAAFLCSNRKHLNDAEMPQTVRLLDEFATSQSLIKERRLVH